MIPGGAGRAQSLPFTLPTAVWGCQQLWAVPLFLCLCLNCFLALSSAPFLSENPIKPRKVRFPKLLVPVPHMEHPSGSLLPKAAAVAGDAEADFGAWLRIETSLAQLCPLSSPLN